MRYHPHREDRPAGTPRGAAGLAPLRLGFVLSLTVFTALSFARPATRPVVPRGPDAIRAVLDEGPHAGECERCHSMHGDEAPAPSRHALVGPDDNTLCDGCHTTAWADGSYGGTWLYAGSAHGSAATMIWPGPDPPARGEVDAAGKCVNCHDPHGWTDGLGRIPGLRLAREENLCLTCHDGYPAVADIRSDVLKPFAHPVNLSGRHAGASEALPSDFAITPVNRRHAECEDCHNPHLARADAAPLPAPDASKRLLGVSRVAVLNGPAGSPPGYVLIAGSDTLTAPVAEYQLCFKCHSSWTTQPPGQTDLARVLNPNNPSFHPVEAAGRNPAIHPLAFVTGWTAMSLTRCDDCHGSDFESNAGPHGSIHRHLLRAPYDPAPSPRMTSEDELCFRCHDFNVYVNASSPQSVQSRSRFNEPGADKGHAAHVGDKDVPCGACHVTHGSTSRPQLIVTGRVPGIVSFTSTPTGGTCAPTCHGTKSYTVNYGR